uniref:Ubiquitin-conjugating enzyme E2 Z n=1 Tax=Florenciella sp. virus SA2 TaxID=3240092 RepID=A0AB39JC19_9VIRU
MNESFKRIAFDIVDLQKNPIENIYYFPNEDNILEGTALIIGPENTPYQYGNYIFEFYFPTEYPYKPPKVIYKSNDGKTRFNPNFYRNGKVCLSILNTWSGDQWSACQTIRSVLLTLQTTMNEMPLLNEPGVTISNKLCILKYNQIIEYKNIEVTILNYIKDIENIPVKNNELTKIIIEKFQENKDKIMDNIINFMNKYSKSVYVELYIYDLKCMLYYNILHKTLLTIINKN